MCYNNTYYFKIGDQILARWSNGIQYPATIESKNKDGTWNIKWKDGIPALQKNHTSQSLQHDFKVTHKSGGMILAKWDDGNLYFATLGRQNTKGNWDITWDDGATKLTSDRLATDLLPTRKSPMVNIEIFFFFGRLGSL